MKLIVTLSNGDIATVETSAQTLEEFLTKEVATCHYLAYDGTAISVSQICQIKVCEEPKKVYFAPVDAPDDVDTGNMSGLF